MRPGAMSRSTRRAGPPNPTVWRAMALSLLLATSTLHAQAPLPDARTATPQAIAAALLDAGHEQKARDTLAREVAPRAPEVVAALVNGLPLGNEDEEYRRIPWIWRVAVAAGRTRQVAALKGLMDGAMPADREPLRDWQAVVLGGGVVMGLSQAGAWPRDEITPWLAEDTVRQMRWAHALTLAERMADDARVRNGTRYDALRMLAVLPYDRVGAQLTRYLARDVDPELQMGAIGGLSDLQDDRVAGTLLQHLPQYTERNRGLALAALLRTDARKGALKAAIAAGTVQALWLTPEQRAALGL